MPQIIYLHSSPVVSKFWVFFVVFLQFLSHIHSAVFQNCNEDIGVDEDDDDDDDSNL